MRISSPILPWLVLLASSWSASRAFSGTVPPREARPAAAHPGQAGPGAIPAAWAPLAFLVGEWDGSGSGAPGPSAGGFTLLPDLAGQVLIRRSFSQSSQGRHEDLMVIYQSPPSGIKAFYTDAEGHTINYTVIATEAPRKAVFLSEEVPTTPRFRLTYQENPDSTLSIRFEIAPPGSSEFKTYIEGPAKRR